METRKKALIMTTDTLACPPVSSAWYSKNGKNNYTEFFSRNLFGKPFVILKQDLQTLLGELQH